MTALLTLLFIAFLIWLWQDGLRAREVALRRAAAACREYDVQLLDQTVAVSRIRLGRSPSGQLQLRRHFNFEFTTDGTERRQGRAILLGNRLEYLDMDWPEAKTVVDYPGIH